MARKRMRMEKIRQIIRYSITTEMSERQIARALNVSRTVVSKYAGAFKASGLSLAELDGMADSELVSWFEGKDRPLKIVRYQALYESFPSFLKRLRKKGVTLQLLWEDYRRECLGGYEYSQFCYHFHSWRKSTSVTMHIDHKAGDKMFVNRPVFTGETII